MEMKTQQSSFPLRLVVLSILAMASSRPVTANATLTIDLKNGSTDPEKPVVNIKAAETLAIKVVPPCECWRLRLRLAPKGDTTEAIGSSFAIKFDSPKALAIPGVGLFVDLIKSEKRKAGATVESHGNGIWSIYVPDPTTMLLDVSIDTKTSNESLAAMAKALGSTPEELKLKVFPVPVELEFATYQLFWSGGFSFLDLRDQRYRIDSIPGDADNLKLVRLRDGEISYQVMVLGHYCDVGTRALCWSVGLGTEVPSDGVTVGAGLSGRMRVIPIADSMYITLGAAYGRHHVLGSSFEGRTTNGIRTVPVGTTTSAVLESRYDVRFFVTLSFGFLGGGAKDFTGIYAGKGSQTPK
jgi:hypothetical protein